MALDDLWGVISAEHGQDGLKIATLVYAKAPEDSRQKLLEALALSRGLVRTLLAEERQEDIDEIDLINTVTGLFYPRLDQVDLRILLGRHLSLDMPELALKKPELDELDKSLQAYDTAASRMKYVASSNICKATKSKTVTAAQLCNLPGLETLHTKLRFSLRSSPELEALFERVAQASRSSGDISATSQSAKDMFLSNLFSALLAEGQYKTLPNMYERIRKADDCDQLATWLRSFGLHAKRIPATNHHSAILVTLSE